MTLPLVHVFSLGGTIAMTSAADGAGVVPNLTGQTLVEAVPALDRVATVKATSFRTIPGAQLTFTDLIALSQEIENELAGTTSGVVVTQGTDTIEETAFALDLLVRSPKPVVVTGAMRNPTLPGADGPANLLASVVAAQSSALQGLGTTVLLGDEIHAARFVRKVHTSNCGAFQSPMTGPLGWVSENQARVVVRLARGPLLRPNPAFAESSSALVALHTVTLGDDGRSLASLEGLGYRGLVVEALGGGHVPAAMVAHLASLAENMPVVLASRAGAGETLRRTYGFPGSETDLLKLGLLSSGLLDGRKSRVLLTLLLLSGADREEIAAALASYLS